MTRIRGGQQVKVTESWGIARPSRKRPEAVHWSHSETKTLVWATVLRKLREMRKIRETNLYARITDEVLDGDTPNRTVRLYYWVNGVENCHELSIWPNAEVEE